MSHRITRRRFVGSGLKAVLATSVAPVFVPASALGKDGAVAPSNRVAVAVLGVGGRGLMDLHGVMADPRAQIVAVCDVNDARAREARWRVNKHLLKHEWSWGCAMSGDHREVVARKDVDAVLVASPDHWHVLMAIDALKAGKDLYLEKPMGLTLAENQALRSVVRGSNRIFQFGTQQRASREFQRAVSLVRNGRIGKVKQINVWALASRPGGSTTPAPVPAGLDYDRWLGPAPKSPYTLGKCMDDEAKGIWLDWWFNTDYCLGFIAGWGVHPIDIAAWGHPAMFEGPMEIEGRCVIPKEGFCNTSISFEANFTFADGVRLCFRGYPNRLSEPVADTDFSEWEKRYRSIMNHGTAFEGSEGWIRVHRGGVDTAPEELVSDRLADAKFVPHASEDHYRDWLDSIQSRKPAGAGFEDAYRADLLCHVADIACRLRRKLKFDPVTERFVGDDEANRRLGPRPMREPWKLPA